MMIITLDFLSPFFPLPSPPRTSMFGDPPDPPDVIMLPAPPAGEDGAPDPRDEKLDAPEPAPSTIIAGPLSLDAQLTITVIHRTGK